MAEVIAKATDVEVIYGDKPALDKINMSVKKGDIYALIGKNGAGKTTLLRLFTGQNAPDYGNIELFGKKGTHGLNEARKRTGAIIETPAFYPFFSAERNLEYYRIQRGIDDPSIVETVLKETGLYEAKDKKFKNFSLGMKQRLGLARVLAGQAQLLLMDEPFAALDFLTRAELQTQLLTIQQRLPRTIVLVTHQLEEALLLGQKIVVMHPDSTICEFDLTDLPYPRDPDSPRLRQLKEQITAQCRMATAN